jgi:hypothetical protein
MLRFLKRAGFDVVLSCSSYTHRNHSTALTAVQPSFSAIGCKTLNIFIKVCYTVLCLSSPIPADPPIPF